MELIYRLYTWKKKYYDGALESVIYSVPLLYSGYCVQYICTFEIADFASLIVLFKTSVILSLGAANKNVDSLYYYECRWSYHSRSYDL